MASRAIIPAHRTKTVTLTLPAQSVYESGVELTLEIANAGDSDAIYELYWRDDGKAAVRVSEGRQTEVRRP